ncbi:MAG: hypothetical protein LC778_01070 [Acidobacteria bacterium]|nr:hypothetical protein [Acidobacteriota bacterium]
MKLLNTFSEKLSIVLFLATFVLILPLAAAAQGKIVFQSVKALDRNDSELELSAGLRAITSLIGILKQSNLTAEPIAYVSYSPVFS